MSGRLTCVSAPSSPLKFQLTEVLGWVGVRDPETYFPYFLVPELQYKLNLVQNILYRRRDLWRMQMLILPQMEVFHAGLFNCLTSMFT